MPKTPFLFDAVVFDLDGTLVATDRFWVDAARAGARRAFAELGIEHPMPTAEQWMSLVGHPIAEGFSRLFGDLAPAQRALVRRRCEEEEHSALKSGQAALLPGVADALTALKERGAKLGIASNCGQDYLDAMMHGLGLARWIDEARCLDSPGVTSKASMVGDLMEAFGTRAAVMVGDRLGDRNAAWENGIPHVHSSRGFAQPGEDVPCEATIEEMGQLVPRLERRGLWIRAALEALGFLAAAGARSPAGSDGSPSTAGSRGKPPTTLGITGHAGAGKTLFARDCARILASAGQATAVLALDVFQKPGITNADLSSTGFWAVDRPLDHLERGYDLETLVLGVLAPHQKGRGVSFDRDGLHVDVPADSVLVLQGDFLLHPKVRQAIDRVVHLEVSESQSLRRVAGRDARKRGPESLLAVRRLWLPTQRAFDEAVNPTETADLVLDAENALGPG
jgi:phosphoglycolate phosphatase-like HAD superfamily hydrolase/uridine kinase